jgi:hypothetical protein
MHRTYNTFRHFVAGIALVLAIFAAPAAHAQSVKGQGMVRYGWWVTEEVEVKVTAYTLRDGAADGSIHLRGWSYAPIRPRLRIDEDYRVEALSVVGNQATVWARRRSDGLLYTFGFLDNGDGSVAPDSYLTMNGWTPLDSGDFTVTP